MPQFMQQGQSLQNFVREKPVSLFQDAQDYPDFFKNYLLDPNRVIKIFENDPHAYERIFYYQYLKLCGELDHEDSSQLINNLLQLLEHPEFVFIFPHNNHQAPFTDHQFKRLCCQFLDLLQHQKIQFQKALSVYPIMDLVFTYMLRSLLIFNEKTTSIDDFVDFRETLADLSRFFGLEISQFSNCIKFTDSDIFVYQENQQAVYMAYVDENPASSQCIENKYGKKNQLYMSNNSSGIYDFIDYTSYAQDGGNNNSDEFKQKSSRNSTFLNPSQEIPKMPKQVVEENQFHQDSFDSQNAQNPINHYMSVVLPNTQQQQQRTRLPHHSTDNIKQNNTLIQPNSINHESEEGFCESSCEQYEQKQIVGIHVNTVDSTPRVTIQQNIESQKQKSKVNFYSNNEYLETERYVEEIQFNGQFGRDKFEYYFNQEKNGERLEEEEEERQGEEEQIYEEEEERIEERQEIQQKSSGEQRQQEGQQIRQIIKQQQIWQKQQIFREQQQINKKQKNQEYFQTYNIYSQIPSNIAKNRVKNSQQLSFMNPKQIQKYQCKKLTLNITKQFTNSIILKQMKEPFSHNTNAIRQRARMYRKSINHVLGYTH